MGWVLLVKGEPYAVGSREYCIAVVQGLCRERARGAVIHVDPYTERSHD